MTKGQRATASLLAIIAVLLGLNVILLASAKASATNSGSDDLDVDSIKAKRIVVANPDTGHKIEIDSGHGFGTFHTPPTITFSHAGKGYAMTLKLSKSGDPEIHLHQGNKGNMILSVSDGAPSIAFVSSETLRLHIGLLGDSRGKPVLTFNDANGDPRLTLGMTDEEMANISLYGPKWSKRVTIADGGVLLSNELNERIALVLNETGPALAMRTKSGDSKILLPSDLK